MKPTSVSPTDHGPTVGETASFVSSSPCTTHGWRPISVKSQPARLRDERQAIADDGEPQEAVAALEPAGPRASHRPAAAKRTARKPSPIMIRNVQYVTPTIGL